MRYPPFIFVQSHNNTLMKLVAPHIHGFHQRMTYSFVKEVCKHLRFDCFVSPSEPPEAVGARFSSQGTSHPMTCDGCYPLWFWLVGSLTSPAVMTNR